MPERHRCEHFSRLQQKPSKGALFPCTFELLSTLCFFFLAALVFDCGAFFSGQARKRKPFLRCKYFAILLFVSTIHALSPSESLPMPLFFFCEKRNALVLVPHAAFTGFPVCLCPSSQLSPHQAWEYHVGATL